MNRTGLMNPEEKFDNMLDNMPTEDLQIFVQQKMGKQNVEVKQIMYEMWMQMTCDLALQELASVPLDQELLSNQFFPHVIDRLGEVRREFAHLVQDEDTVLFGKRRDAAAFSKALAFGTPMSKNGKYSNCNKAICDWMIQSVKTTSKKSKKKKFKKLIVKEDRHNQLSSSIRIRVLSIQELKNGKLLEFDENELPEWFPRNLYIKASSPEVLSEEENQLLYDSFKRLKNECPELYDRSKLYNVLGGFAAKIQNHSKDFFIIADAAVQVGNRMLPTSQYITYLAERGGEHPLERMRQEAAVLIEHQDKYLIEETMQEIGNLFAGAICAGRGNKVAEMQNYTARMQYLFNHCCPFARGSASVSEALATIIYRSCGFDVKWLKKPDLEALAQPIFSVFLENYPQILKLVRSPVNVPKEIHPPVQDDPLPPREIQSQMQEDGS